MTERLGALLLTLLLMACTAVPEGIAPVPELDTERYLGTWYEIARLDHSFERGLDSVTARYSRHPDGGLRVLNRGYDSEAGEWQEAEGRARYAGDQPSGHLEVSFFGPFYSSYVIFELDPDYQYAFVSGYNRDYLWLLSRTPKVSEALRERFVDEARARGFAVEELQFISQARHRCGAGEAAAHCGTVAPE
ncbi:lipocalin family protein [Haliea atlantica]|mgnify:CR=1 FL=1|nr:lipocalin [Haliea sp.]|tara:strand:- start:73228 stop:73800 length:573 start_codon:yes stop_codon:yes gene_type:complete